MTRTLALVPVHEADKPLHVAGLKSSGEDIKDAVEEALRGQADVTLHVNDRWVVIPHAVLSSRVVVVSEAQEATERPSLVGLAP